MLEPQPKGFVRSYDVNAWAFAGGEELEHA